MAFAVSWIFCPHAFKIIMTSGFTNGKWKLEVHLHFIDNKKWVYIAWKEEVALICRLFGKYVPSAYIARASSRLSLCACAVTSSFNWGTTEAISWNSCYVYVCSCGLNMFKTIEGAADWEILSVIRFFLKLGLCYRVRFITRSFKCMVTIRWVMAGLGNGFGCSMKEERMRTMRRDVGIHLWWMMIWCVSSTKECVTRDFPNFWSVSAFSSNFKDPTLWQWQ